MKHKMRMLGAATLAAATASALLTLAPASVALASTTAVAQGVLTDPNGNPIPNATVYLYAEPPSDSSFWTTVQPGQTIPRDILGTATTDSTGTYSLSVSNWTAAQQDADSNGVVNLSVESFPAVGSSGSAARHDFSRDLFSSSGTLQLGADSLGTEDATAGSTTPATVNLSAITVSTTSGIPPPCGLETLLKDLGQKTGTVGGGWSGAPVQATTNFTYGQSQESAMGAAIQLNSGAWSVDGSVDAQQTSSAFQGWPGYGITSGSGIFFQTQFEYGRFAEVCSNNEVHVMHWDGGSSHASNTTAPSPCSGCCVHEDAGSNFKINYSSATTFAGGLQISGVIGFNLSAHTGYSTTGELHMHNTLAARLCGTASSPGNAPKRLVYEGP